MLSPKNSLSVWLLGILAATKALPIPIEEKSCPNYERHSRTKHEGNRSVGRFELPFQRPTPECRTYFSEEVEEAIERLRPTIQDPDLFRLFENSYPNTLDTMVKWKGFAWANETLQDAGGFTDEDLAFVITGDMYVDRRILPISALADPLKQRNVAPRLRQPNPLLHAHPQTLDLSHLSRRPLPRRHQRSLTLHQVHTLLPRLPAPA